MVHEAQMHERNCFVTLTYEDDEQVGLDVEHWQKFAKRVRKEYGPFRFFHCGEYGEVGFRPHYHACIFGLDFPDKTLRYTNRHGDRVYDSPSLKSLWGHGHVSLGSVSWQSAAYVARYVMKKLTGNAAVEEYGDLRPPYCTMSRNPGIGASWIEKYRSDVYPEGVVIHNGKKFPAPRFYDELQPEEVQVSVKARRAKQARRHQSDLTPKRLKVREKVKELQTDKLRRQL